LDVALTVTVGRDTRLGDELSALARRMKKPLEVLGWVQDLPALLRSHHVLIGKAGGATVQESLAAHTPMLITRVLPGQETGNAQLLLQYGCGAHVPTSEAVIRVLAGLFENAATGWQRMHRNCLSLGQPDAAIGNASWILHQLNPTVAAPSVAGIRPDRTLQD
jgi:processive 1,2-diacylglycerol beta-glucosyltransferase